MALITLCPVPVSTSGIVSTVCNSGCSVTPPPYVGGCLCGAVRYTCREKPTHVYFCHCLDCQKESGSPFVTELYLPRPSVTISGMTTRYTRTADTGMAIHRNFCPSCGTVVLTEFDMTPDFVSVKACSLDDASWLVPEFHLYITRKQPWLKLGDGLPQYEKDF